MLTWLAAAVHYYRGQLAVRRSAYAQGALAFAEVARLQPRNPQALHYHAWCLIRAGDVDGAIKAYRRLLTLVPTLAIGHFELGSALQERGFHAEAIESFQNAAHYGLDEGVLYYNWGVSLTALDRSREALEQYRTAISRSPHLCDAYGNIGATLLHGGQPEEAIQWLQKTIACAPLELFFYNLAHAYQLRELYADERATLLRGLTIHPTSVQLTTQLATVFVREKSYDDASALLVRAMDFDPTAPEPLIVMSFLHQARGDYQQAIRWAKRVVQAVPNDQRALGRLGAALLAAGDAKAGLEYFVRAVALEPDNAEYLAGQGAALAVLGQLKDSKVIFNRVLAMDPSYFDDNEMWRAQVDMVMANDVARRTLPPS